MHFSAIRYIKIKLKNIIALYAVQKEEIDNGSKSRLDKNNTKILRYTNINQEALGNLISQR
jgi:hypothetical protein